MLILYNIKSYTWLGKAEKFAKFNKILIFFCWQSFLFIIYLLSRGMQKPASEKQTTSGDRGLAPRFFYARCFNGLVDLEKHCFTWNTFSTLLTTFPHVENRRIRMASMTVLIKVMPNVSRETSCQFARWGRALVSCLLVCFTWNIFVKLHMERRRTSPAQIFRKFVSRETKATFQQIQQIFHRRKTNKRS